MIGCVILYAKMQEQIMERNTVCVCNQDRKTERGRKREREGEMERHMEIDIERRGERMQHTWRERGKGHQNSFSCLSVLRGALGVTQWVHLLFGEG